MFGVSPSAVLESVGKSLSYWSTGNGEDTMVTLWNPADEAQDFIFTLFFAGGQYALPLHLEGKVTRSFNISEIIANQIPDELGRTIPLSIHEGSAVLTGSQGESEHILVAMESGTYNVQKATCGSTYCKTCMGATEPFIDSDPWGLPVASSVQETFTAQYNTGSQFNLTSAASWTSGNTSIATVSSGKVAARAAGTTFVAANDPNTPDYTSGCYAYAIECPLETGPSAQAPGGASQLVCSPASVTRGSQVTCTLQGPGTASSWSFTSSDSHGSVSSSSGTTSTSWSGTAVDSGTVTATATNGSASTNVSGTFTITPRAWAFSPYSAVQVSNGDPTLPTLPVPPESNGDDSGLGYFSLLYSDTGFNPTTINAGPNSGYTYVASKLNVSAGYFHWVINPDLANQSSAFSQHQYGACGYISWSNLDGQTIRHESGAAESHYSEYISALSGSNPGTYFEAQIAGTSDNASNVFAGLRTQLNSMYQALGSAAAQENIPPVNYSAANVFLGNINYLVNGQYATCP
ncbi:MAG: hypothetical protein JO340_04115 [Acidobacteriaceae bacterium]|nr:hypothetical protein [Acidobacteriaceae bacterium]